MQKIVLGGGCFWCVEAVMQKCKGVLKVISGYAGGELQNPDYELVSSGRSGYVEVVWVEFDEKIICLEELLKIFLAMHDPTSLNRQGNDFGTQYRSVIYCFSDDQIKVAVKLIKKIEQKKFYQKPIVTEVKLLNKFYEAEKYHQNYYIKNREQFYCQLVISPKLAQFREKFEKYFRE